MAGLRRMSPFVPATAGTTNLHIGLFIREAGSGHGVGSVCVTPSVLSGRHANAGLVVNIRQLRAGVFIKNIATLNLGVVDYPASVPIFLPLSGEFTSLQNRDHVDVSFVQDGTSLADLAVGALHFQVKVS